MYYRRAVVALEYLCCVQLYRVRLARYRYIDVPVLRYRYLEIHVRLYRYFE